MIKQILIEMAKEQVEQNNLDPFTFIKFTRYLDTLSESKLRDIAELAILESKMDERMAVDNKELSDVGIDESFGTDSNDSPRMSENDQLDESALSDLIYQIKHYGGLKKFKQAFYRKPTRWSKPTKIKF